MTKVIGQRKIVEILSTYTFKSMPTSLLLLGSKGSGKHFLASELANQLEVDLIELTSKTTSEELLDILQSPVVRLCWIDLTEVDEKAQNKFLKFIEEPPTTLKVLLGAESEVGILPTILNRCHKLTLENYTEAELRQFSWTPESCDPKLFKFCNTPGKLLALSTTADFQQIERICLQLVTQMPQYEAYNYANVMTLVTRINCKKSEQQKWDMGLFLDVFADTAFEVYKTSKAPFSLEAYKLVTGYKKQLINKTLNKEAFMLSFFNDLWEIAHK